jgi:hypothetical protein
MRRLLQLSVCAAMLVPLARAAQVDFKRDVQPILKQYCHECHGEKRQKSGVRLDHKASAFAEADSGKRPIVPGKSGDSPLLQRVTTTNHEEVMPPKGDKLSPAQVAVLRAWIDEGAAWPDEGPVVQKKHWAYEKPARPPLPAVKQRQWPLNGIDYFILARLESEKLAPSPAAERAAWLRRVSLDLIGLPPSVADLQQFLADQNTNAFENAVDRLLASPHYGERWAKPWLDLARYADTQGYEKDNRRTMWPWRDWVIRALNANMPFDQFTIEQIAGDLLPNATRDQRVATGFHRNTMTNTEGGTDDEEFRHEAVVDRVNTTMAVWMATTMSCAQCHNHKYDPLTMKEYYQMYAFLNHTADSDKEDERPTLKLFGDGQEAELARLRAASKAAEARWTAAVNTPEITNAFNLWVEQATAQVLNTNSAPAKEAKPATKIPDEIQKILRIAADKRDDKQRNKLKEHFGATAPELKEPREALAAARKAEKELNDSIPLVAVMEELPKPRPTHMLVRGSFLTKGEPVQPGVPAVLHSLPPDAAPNRLAFARWLVDTNNPLTARVIMNRFWEQFFGIGLVETSEDFGTQGEPPSHPELLDWLATEFMASGWNMKAMHKLIALSATYRQSSKVSPELFQKDPYNRQLARGPRARLDAEAVRDQALAVAGLLSPKLGGPPVMPPQPDGIWQVVYSGDTWQTSPGEDKYRRGLYTFWRRTSPYPSMITFDAPSREFCVVRRTRSNTPLQALTLLNDPVYVECASSLARRMIETGGMNWEDRAAAGIRAALLRDPREGEIEKLTELADAQVLRFNFDKAAAKKLSHARSGESDALVVDRAAWTVVANVLLNLDEFVMKP